jgi:copper homeostasis protein
MEAEIDSLKKLPITGIVLGVLQDDRSINLEDVQRLSERADPLPVTFHKAIDETRDPLQEMKKLSRIQNIQSILSSGGAQNAETGAKMLKTMQQEFQSRFRMIAAGSITSENLLSLHHKIGFPEYHGRKIVGDLARSSLQKQGSGRTDQLGLKISI